MSERRSKLQRAGLDVPQHTAWLFRRIAERVAPPPDLSVSEWSDRYRVLSPESCAEPGPWSTDRVPHLREIMDAINDPGLDEAVVMTSSQVGKTSLLENIIGYYIDYDPSPIMVVLPILEMAHMFSKDRLAPMLRDSPRLQGKVKDAKGRDSGNTMLHKTFAGGHITLVGANSPSSLASRPIRIVLCDEVDRYPVSAGTEGDPISLVRKRTTTFWNKKVVLVSTPTTKGTSRIETAYEESTQEQWCLPCPSCGEYQPLTWSQINFETVTHTCRACGAMDGEMKWKARFGRWIAREPGKRVRGFHLNELASPWKRWDTIIAEFHEARRNGPEALRVFVNTSLGESWEEEGESPDEELLEGRRHWYECVVPAGVLVLTAGVDVQDTRLEVEVVGWGAGKESWGIQYAVFPGDPNQQAVWDQMDEFLLRTWERADGRRMGISCTCIDSGGHCTTAVYQFCRPREHRRVFAIKGQGGTGLPIVGKYSRVGRQKCALFPVGVDTGKELIFSRLKVAEEGLAGFMHFPREMSFADGTPRGFDQAFFKGLLSERRVLRYSRGVAYHAWVKKSGARNEPLDIRNYATAALEILNPSFEALARALGAVAYRQGQAMTTPAGTSTQKRGRRQLSKGVQA